ncbi:MAG: fasciclin domain-containing protein [Gemmatimonadales bacterium]|nr:fasciclin domain-containing protein [Gemmatimonadales bacterium]
MVGGFKHFLQLVGAAGWASRLTGSGEYTLLAPVDGGFREVTAERLDSLRADTTRASVWLRAHLIEGDHSLADLLRGGSVRTLDGSSRPVTRDAKGVYHIAGAMVVAGELSARNGMVIGMDRALPVMPEAGTAGAPARERASPER